MELDYLLLAAGYGSRLRPLTDCMPKALLPIYGTPLLDLHLAAIGRAGRIVINTHHLAAQIAEHVRRHPWHDRITLSHEPKIRGTGGALVHARKLLFSDPCVVINTDTLYTPPLEAALQHHRAGGYPATMILSPDPLHRNVTAQAGRATGILLDRTNEDAFTFTGCHLVSQELIAQLPAAGFHDIRETYLELIRRGQLGAYIDDRGAGLIDIGTPQRYLAAHRAVRAPVGIQLAEDYGFIDAGAHIGAGARIRGSIVMSAAKVDAGCLIEHAIVAPGARVSADLINAVITPSGVSTF